MILDYRFRNLLNQFYLSVLIEFEQYAKNISVPSGEDILDVAFE